MTNLRSDRSLITPRLLTCPQAAVYCGLSAAAFNACCPVPAVSLGADRRLLRYDLHQLDAWIDKMGGKQFSGSKDWLAELDRS